MLTEFLNISVNFVDGDFHVPTSFCIHKSIIGLIIRFSSSFKQQIQSIMFVWVVLDGIVILTYQKETGPQVSQF